MYSLDFMGLESFDLSDAQFLADLIRINKITELQLSGSFNPQLEITEKLEIYHVLLDSLAQNNSLLVCDLDFIDILVEDEEINSKIHDKIIYVFSTRTVPIRFTNLYTYGDDELDEFMQLQIDNYAISSKTLIQILREYKK